MNLEEKNNEGLLLLQQGENERALKIFEECFREKEEPVFAYNAGLALYREDQFQIAKNWFQEAIELSGVGEYKEAEAMFGMCCLELRDYETAVHALECAGGQDAVSVVGQIDLGRLEVGLGFCNFESRHKKVSTWDGTESLVGKTILVEGTEGLGDQIFFARWIPWLRTLGAAYIDVLVSEPLRGVFGEVTHFCSNRIKVLTVEPNKEDYDHIINLGSLGYIFCDTIGKIPAQPYIWYNTFSYTPQQPTSIGLCWSGNPLHAGDKKRSIPLELLKPLYELRGYDFNRLQKDVRASDEEVFEASNIGRPTISQVEDLAEEIDCQDLIITVDTLTANLAGAMGKPTWVLVPYTCDWRWTFEGEKTPWYPSVRVFRQGEDRRWEPVIERVVEELKKLGENNER